jgi:hypothetical protein
LAKFDGVVGQDVLSVSEKENELTIVLRDNRFIFVKVENCKLVVDSIPE